MGRLPIHHGPEAHDRPPEPHDEGCPGAWYRCAFVASLMPYERPVSSDGVYSPNPRLDRCDDPLILDAIQLLEHERARALSFQRERMTA